MTRSIGEQIAWRTLNSIKTGVIEAKRDYGYLVRLDNGKCVIVHENSIIKNGAPANK